jgi:mRNA interferase RelE/StbE
MAYSIQFKPVALRQLEELPRDTQRRIAAKIEDLREYATPVGSKKLSGLDDTWRIRIGDYRVVYQLRRAVLLVLVLKIGHRREIYR